MKPYQVDAQLEKYIPEYKAYIETNTFTQQEIQQINKQREKYERQIQESYTPLLEDFVDYLQHLKSTTLLAKQRFETLNNNINDQLMQNDDQANQVAQQELPIQFSLPQQQYQRLYRMVISSNRNNYKMYTYLTKFAVDINNFQLLNTITDSFVQFHSYYYLSWLFKAKSVELQEGFIAARRIYNQSLSYIKNFVQHNNAKYINQELNENEKIKQNLPIDIFKIFYNWLILELQFIKDLIKNIDEQQLKKQLQQSDSAINQIISGYFIQLIMKKAILILNKFQKLDEQNFYSQLLNNQSFAQFYEEVCQIESNFKINHIKIHTLLYQAVSQACYEITQQQTELNIQLLGSIPSIFLQLKNCTILQNQTEQIDKELNIGEYKIDDLLGSEDS